MLPPADVTGQTDLDSLAALLDHGAPVLVGEQGERVPLDGSAREALRQAVVALRAGQAITVGASPTTLTTQQAAQLLGVSRPTLVKLLDDGVIPHERPRGHRRVRLADVLAYRETRRTRRREGLDALVRQSEDDDLYDTGRGAVAS
jgi:excisionase family DNA binding protein